IQAQKMESIGRLAGGVAHDFNNLLSVIIGYSDLALQQLPEGERLHEYMHQIRAAGDRATGLTRQLLAFSRQQVLQPQNIDLNAVLLRVEELLRRVIGEDIKLSLELQPDLYRVMADPGQIEQVVMNLAVNARDAMPGGGWITIETTEVELDGCAPSGAAPGAYVLLAVSDTGCGMSAEVQSHLFEPFFTTKAPGQGMGLGLFLTRTVLARLGGRLELTSRLGQGTTAVLMLPVTAAAYPVPPMLNRVAARG
ncbi:MAG: sensor histidine kinase, partial [Gaiellaceae bacterium]